MIEIRNFLIAQHLEWFKRANLKVCDNWSYDLMKLSNGNCFTLSLSEDDKSCHPLLFGFSNSLKNFLKEFYNLNDNFRMSFLLNNPIIVRERGSRDLLNHTFFIQHPGLDHSKLAKLRFCDVFF